MTAVTTTPDHKAEATLRAQLALAGHAVHRAADGGYLACRMGYIKFCRDLAELEKFARLVGAIKQEVHQ